MFPPAQDKLRDKLGVMHSKAQLLLQLRRPEAAEALFRKLLVLNPDDYRVHEGLQLCLGIQPPKDGQTWQQQQQAAAAGGSSSEAARSSSSSSVWSPHSGKKRRLLQAYSEEQRGKLVALYGALGQQYPKSMACQRIPLDFLVSLFMLCYVVLCNVTLCAAVTRACVPAHPSGLHGESDHIGSLLL